MTFHDKVYVLLKSISTYFFLHFVDNYVRKTAYYFRRYLDINVCSNDTSSY